MGFIPKLDFSIETSLSKDEVLRKLKEVTWPDQKVPRRVPFRGYSELFYGQIGSFNFNICPAYNNSFVPVIYGEVYGKDDGAIVNIQLRMIEFVCVFWIIWLSFAALFFITMLLFLVSGQSFSFGMLVPLILFAFGYCLGFFGFRYEALSTRNKLEEICYHI